MFQSAYKARHGTETALLKVVNDILCAIDDGNVTLLTMLDLSAAFDTIDHAILVERLKISFGINGVVLDWIGSYLSDRKQKIKIDNDVSSEIPIKYGVPQGSVLGPILFTLYTTPLSAIVRRHGLSYHFYADDSQLYILFRPKDPVSREDAIAKVQACAEDIRCWMSKNMLKLNDDKTELIIITTNRENPKPSFTIRIGSDDISPASDSEPPKNLGVYIDSCLNFQAHISKVVKTINYALFNIGKTRKFLDKPTCESIINGLTTSRLDYCNSLLYGANEKDLDKLQCLQNRAARILTHTPKFSHITGVMKGLHWLPVRQRIQYKILLTVFKCRSDLAPAYLVELLTPYAPTRSLRSSDKNLLEVPKTRLKTYGDRSFQVAGPILWNSLPLRLRQPMTVDAFKKELKTYLFTAAYNE